MGAWSTGIFGSDTAADIRAEYRDLLAGGTSGEDASRILLEQWNSSLHEADEAPEVWIALAASQAECGRLQPYVLERALEMIDSGAEVRRWERLDAEPADVKRRAGALAVLRDKLVGPQRKPVRVRPRYASRLDWQVGHAIGYRLLSQRWVILRVLRVQTGGRGPDVATVDVCDWIGLELPAGEQITRLPRRHTSELQRELERIESSPVERGDPEILKALGIEEPANETDSQRRARFKRAAISRNGKMAIYEEKRGEFPSERVRVITQGLPVEADDQVGTSCFGGWARLDEHLRTRFDLS